MVELGRHVRGCVARLVGDVQVGAFFDEQAENVFVPVGGRHECSRLVVIVQRVENGMALNEDLEALEVPVAARVQHRVGAHRIHLVGRRALEQQLAQNFGVASRGRK